MNNELNELNQHPLHRGISGGLLAGSDLLLLDEELRQSLPQAQNSWSEGGHLQAEALSIIAEANKRIDRLEDKRKAYQAPKAQAPRTPQPLMEKEGDSSADN